MQSLKTNLMRDLAMKLEFTEVVVKVGPVSPGPVAA